MDPTCIHSFFQEKNVGWGFTQPVVYSPQTGTLMVIGGGCACPFNTSPQYLWFKLLPLCDPCTQVPEDP